MAGSDPDNNKARRMLELKSAYLIPCVYHFYREPMVLERGAGCRLYDTSGKSYLDCYSGVGVTNCGHGQATIVARGAAQLRRLQHTTTIYLTEPMLLLAEALAHFMPGECTRSFFCTSGSEANEGALLLAKLATGRNDFIALSRALHGRTWLTAGVTGLPFWRTDPAPPQNIHFAPSPVCSPCPYQLTHPDCDLRCAEAVDQILDEHGSRVAAFIAEPIHGNGGIVVPPPGYFERVQAYLKKHGVLLIMDEAQTGFCRTGKRFGFEHHAIEPDIVAVCKALGNGLPIAAFIARDEIAQQYSKPGASTFGGNLVCAEAARATLAYMVDHELEKRAAEKGRALREKLDRLAVCYPIIREVRGRGLMLGLELAHEDGAPAADAMDDLLEALKDRGILVGKTGPERNVLTLMPPLIIGDADIEELCAALDAAFGELPARTRP